MIPPPSLGFHGHFQSLSSFSISPAATSSTGEKKIMGGHTSASNAVPSKWDAKQIPSLSGKVAVVTGANSGIGYVAALEMARNGAHVVLACRNEERGQAAAAKIQQEIGSSSTTGGGKAEFMQLDVGSLASVKSFTERFQSSHERLDVLVNNAGIMGVPHALSPDGVESQFATNHLGHFALTAQLYPLLQKSAPSRVVNTSSVAHRDAKLDLKEIVTPKDKYVPMKVYSNTKLCNLLFSFELDRRLRASDATSKVIAVTVHPGVTNTPLFNGPAQNGVFAKMAMKAFSALPIGQKVEMGALPTLYAATAPGVQSGEYFGPSGFNNFRGYPALEEPVNQSKSKEAGEKLWAESERLAKMSFEV
ncbi:Ww domain-containing oxidoreductase [Globisporangium polare]